MKDPRSRNDLPVRLRDAVDHIGRMAKAGEIEDLVASAAQEYLVILVMWKVDSSGTVTAEQIEAATVFALRSIKSARRKENVSASAHYRALEEIFGSLDEPKRRSVRVAPGFRFCRMLGYFCTKSTRERVLEAYHAEALADYVEHLSEGRWVGAAIIVALMYPRMVLLVGGASLARFLGSVIAKVKAD